MGANTWEGNSFFDWKVGCHKVDPCQLEVEQGYNSTSRDEKNQFTHL